MYMYIYIYMYVCVIHIIINTNIIYLNMYRLYMGRGRPLTRRVADAEQGVEAVRQDK